MMTIQDQPDPHPWYGPCDALGPGGCCAECHRQAGERAPWSEPWEDKNQPPSPMQNLLEASQNSPLVEADPNSLNELMERVDIVFNMRPLDKADEDVELVVTYFQQRRSRLSTLAKAKELKDAENPRKRPKKTDAEITNLLLIKN